MAAIPSGIKMETILICPEERAAIEVRRDHFLNARVRHGAVGLHGKLLVSKPGWNDEAGTRILAGGRSPKNRALKHMNHYEKD